MRYHDAQFFVKRQAAYALAWAQPGAATRSAFERAVRARYARETEAIADPAEIKRALVRQVVSPVLWEDCMRSAGAAGAGEFWELGPGAVLAGLARRTEKAWKVRSFSEYADLAA